MTVITQAWLLALAKQGFPIESLIDPDQGLVVLEHMTDSPNEDFEGVISAKRLCGEELEKALPKLRKDLARGFKPARQMTKLRSTNCAGEAQTPPSYKNVANPHR